MTTTTDARQLADAALALSRTGRFAAATSLLAATEADDPADAAALALAAAEVAIDQDQFSGTRLGPAALAAAAAVAADPLSAWELELLRVRQEYVAEIFPADGRPRLAPDARDQREVAVLAERAERLVETAPPGARGTLAAFFRGMIADNLAGDHAAAPAWYERALAGGDPLVAWEALRHLGGHDEDAGDRARACERWQRSAELCAASGNVIGWLAQQLLLANAAADPAVRTTLADAVERWAGALGGDRYRRIAADLR
jgi:tetratricopeptide (TPR) repeat protein